MLVIGIAALSNFDEWQDIDGENGICYSKGVAEGRLIHAKNIYLPE